MTTAEFIRALFAGAAGFVTLSWPNRDGAVGRPRWWSSHLAAGDPAAVAAAAQRLDAAGEQVYFGCGLRASDLGAYHRGGKKEVIAVPGLWLDLDLLDDSRKAHAAKNLPTLEQAVELLDGLSVEPSIVVHSGHGLHVWWLFAEGPRALPVAAARGAHEKATIGMLRQVISAAQAKNLHVDYLPSCDRVLRLPGSTNRKRGCPEAPVKVLLGDGPRLGGELFNRFSVSAFPVRPARPAVPPPGGAPVGTGSSSIKKPTETELRDRLTRLSREESRALAAPVLAGESFAPFGDRDPAMQRLAGLLAFTAPGWTAEELCDLIQPSIDVMAIRAQEDGTPEPTREWALEKLDRSIARAEEQREAERRVPDVQSRAARASAPTPEAAAGGSTYSEEEIEEFAAEAGCTRSDFQQRWIVQHGQAYFTFRHGIYQPPVIKEALDLALRKDLALAPVDFTVTTANGGARWKTPGEMVRDYGSLARHLITDLTARRSTYDAVSETFREACAPLRTLSPLRDERVEAWLALLGGQLYEKLLDWIATVTDLSRQSAALYLTGATGAGKTVLAHGLARLWVEGGPTKLEAVVGSFNSSLMHCPLIFADEYLPTVNGRKLSPGALREIVGEDARMLHRKHLPDSRLIGAIRLILAENGRRMLSADEDLQEEDAEAIAGRFLHVHASEAPAAYLRAIGGRTATDDWVKNDVIARHALWLRDTRKVVPGIRFLVTGDARAVGKEMLIQGKTPGLVAEWLAKYCTEDATKRPADLVAQRLVECGNGELLVAVRALTEHWSHYIKSTPVVPPTAHLGRALTAMAHGRKRTRERHALRLHLIDLDYVLAWAQRSGAIEPEAITEAVKRPRPRLVDESKEGANE